MSRSWLAFALLGTLAGWLPAQEDPKELAGKVRSILETNCFRCHGKDGSGEGGFDYILDVKKMIQRRKLVPNEPKKSKIWLRPAEIKDMPPEDEKPRPGADDMKVVERWIKAGAPEFAAPAGAKRPFLTEKDVYKEMYDHLFKNAEDARYLRFLTLTHLHNNPRVGDAEMRLYRAGVAKLLNSLSWGRELVLPKAIDKHEALLVIDLRDLDWDLNDGWLKLIAATRDEPKEQFHPGYQYALTHDRYPEDRELNRLAEQVYKLSGTRIPAVRADWLLATASLAPVYHELLNLPDTAKELETSLKVNVAVNFRRNRLARAGFSRSGVSAQANRLIERHRSAYGYYYKSYDFRSNEGLSNLVRFPLGPLNLFPEKRHPYEDQAFVHDGGEIIFSLPNGLQGYFLINGKDGRINEGPADVVRDKNETAGRSTIIVNGLSCMACHKTGTINEPNMKDGVRGGAGLQGEAMEKVRRLYPESKEMDRLLKADEKLFVDSLDKVMSPHVRKGPDRDKDVKLFPEPISLLASPFLKGNLTLEEAALELGLDDPKELESAIKNNAVLSQKLGLKPLLNGDTIKRETWQSTKGFVSVFQQAADELKRGTPTRTGR